MKKRFLLLFILAGFSINAQTDFSTIKLEKDADYKPTEKYALEAVDEIFKKSKVAITRTEQRPLQKAQAARPPSVKSGV